MYSCIERLAVLPAEGMSQFYSGRRVRQPGKLGLHDTGRITSTASSCLPSLTQPRRSLEGTPLLQRPSQRGRSSLDGSIGILLGFESVRGGNANTNPVRLQQTVW